MKAACDAVAPPTRRRHGREAVGRGRPALREILSLDPDYADAKAGLQAAVAKIAEARGRVRGGPGGGEFRRPVQGHRALCAGPGCGNRRGRRVRGAKPRAQRMPPPEGMTLIMPGEFTIGDAAVPGGAARPKAAVVRLLHGHHRSDQRAVRQVRHRDESSAAAELGRQ